MIKGARSLPLSMYLKHWDITLSKNSQCCIFRSGTERERIVIVGIRNDTDIEFSYPNEEDKMTTLREALKGCPKSDGVEYSEKKKRY